MDDEDDHFTARAKTERAKELCAACPVLTDCRALVDRLEAKQQRYHWFGIWAGETPPERARRRRAERSS